MLVFACPKCKRQTMVEYGRLWTCSNCGWYQVNNKIGEDAIKILKKLTHDA